MLGKDAQRSEYWHFKEDTERIYIRKEVQTQASAHSNEMSEELVQSKVYWYCIEEDDKFDHLLQSMNPKGIREKKLLESLRKCRDRLKLRKPKGFQAREQASESAAGQDVEMNSERPALMNLASNEESK